MSRLWLGVGKKGSRQGRDIDKGKTSENVESNERFGKPIKNKNNRKKIDEYLKVMYRKTEGMYWELR